MTTYDEVLAEVQELRLVRRPPLVRAAAVAGGGLAALSGAAMMIVLPELGVPLLLIGLRLLALQFDWAARTYARVRTGFLRVLAWLDAKPRWLRWLITGGLIAVAAALVGILIWL